MSADYLKVYFNCRASNLRELVVRTMGAMRAAILENWQTRSPLPPGFWPDFDESFGSDALARIVAAIETSDSFSDSVVEYFPQACHSLFFSFLRGSEGAIIVEVAVPIKAVDEVEGSIKQGEMVWNWYKTQRSFRRELPGPGDMEEEELRRWYDEYQRHGNTPSVWPQNRLCFLNIIEHLKKALPAKSVELDPRLLQEPAKS